MINIPISRDTCQAALDKSTIDFDSVSDYCHGMRDLMDRRGHRPLFDLLGQLTSVYFPLADDGSATEAFDITYQRFLSLSVALLTYSITLAAHEVCDLNEQFSH